MRSWSPPGGRVLVLAPHPDDEILGCGGAVIAHRRRGDPVKVLFAADGGRGGVGRARPPGLAARRRREARAAARILGVRELEFWDYPDGGLFAARDLTGRLAALLERERPDVVYRPGAEDSHPDHRALARAFSAALGRVRPALLDCRYEVWSCPRPTALLDISRDFARKERAMRAYRSQLASADLLRLSRLRAAARGLLLGGARYAEGYRISLRLAGPRRRPLDPL